MRLSGQEVLSFLNRRYLFVRLVFETSQPTFIVDADVMNQLLIEHNISFKELEEMKFAVQIPTGEFQLNPTYTDFLQFLFKQFVLDLPATLDSRCKNIFELFKSLQIAKVEIKRITFVNEIMKELNHFVIDIKGETNKLIQDTEALKVNAYNNSDLSHRIEKADYWIREYITPLNAILDKNHPNSITSIVSETCLYAGEKSQLEDNFELQAKYTQLYGCVLFAQNEINAQNSKITRELTPLLERIKSDSLILKGCYHFLEETASKGQYDSFIPALIIRRDQTVLAELETVIAQTHFYIDQYENNRPETFIDASLGSPELYTSSEYYKGKLMKVLPVNDFYSWCYTTLKNENQEITLENFFTISNIIMEEELGADYTSKGRINLKLIDSELSASKIRVYAVPK